VENMERVQINQSIIEAIKDAIKRA